MSNYPVFVPYPQQQLQQRQLIPAQFPQQQRQQVIYVSSPPRQFNQRPLLAQSTQQRPQYLIQQIPPLENNNSNNSQNLLNNQRTNGQLVQNNTQARQQRFPSQHSSFSQLQQQQALKQQEISQQYQQQYSKQARTINPKNDQITNLSDLQPILPQQLLDYSDLLNLSAIHKSPQQQQQLQRPPEALSLPTNDQTYMQNINSNHLLPHHQYNNSSSNQSQQFNKSMQYEASHIQEIKPQDISAYNNVLSLDTSKIMIPSEEVKFPTYGTQTLHNKLSELSAEDVSFSRHYGGPQTVDEINENLTNPCEDQKSLILSEGRGNVLNQMETPQASQIITQNNNNLLQQLEESKQTKVYYPQERALTFNHMRSMSDSSPNQDFQMNSTGKQNGVNQLLTQYPQPQFASSTSSFQAIQTHQIVNSPQQQLVHETNNLPSDLASSQTQYSPIQTLHAFMLSTPQKTLLAQSKSPQKPTSVSPQKLPSTTPQKVTFSTPNQIVFTSASPQKLITQGPSIANNTLTASWNPLQNNLISISQGNPAQVQNVSVLYRSQNQPDYHFNTKPTDFHKSPERSKDAASCVFFSQGDKLPQKIKIKYIPVEELLTPQEYEELKAKHINDDKQDEAVEKEEQLQQDQEIDFNHNLNQQQQESVKKQIDVSSNNNNNNNSINFLASSINFLQTVGGSSPEKRSNINELFRKMDGQSIPEEDPQNNDEKS